MLFSNRLTKAALLLTALLFTAPYAASPFFSAERSRNLRTLETTPLLFEYHRETVSGSKQVFYYPRRDTGFRKGFAQSEKRALLGYQDEKQAIAASLVGGIDYRGGERLGDTIWPGIDGGLYLRGYRDSVEFMLDARIYMENHSSDYPKSFDGEFVEFQKEENNSGVEYASYAALPRDVRHQHGIRTPDARPRRFPFRSGLLQQPDAQPVRPSLQHAFI